MKKLSKVIEVVIDELGRLVPLYSESGAEFLADAIRSWERASEETDKRAIERRICRYRRIALMEPLRSTVGA